jgi:predicted nucleotidyltransferase
MLIDPLLREFMEGIAPVREHVRQLTLFGSRARGDQRPDSDYDILVIVDRRSSDLLDFLYDRVMDILLAHGRVVSLKVLEEKDWERLVALRTPFTMRVKKEGRPLG